MDWLMFPEHRESVIGTLRRATSFEIDDSKSQQFVKKMRGLKSEQFEDVHRPQPHGFSSHPPSGSEGIFLALGGRSDRLLALGFEHKDKRYKNLPEGGAAIYDADGKVIKLISDKGVWDNGNKPLEIGNATKIKINGKNDVAIGVDGCWVRVRGGRVDLGVASPDGSAEFGVETSGGTSTVVFAKV